MLTARTAREANLSNSRPSPWWLLGPTVVLAAASALTTRSASLVYEEIVCWSYGHRETDECMRRHPNHYEVVLWTCFAVTIIESLLAWSTVSWLGFLSDRYGRTRILTLAATGSLIANLAIILANFVAGSRVPCMIFLLILGGAIVQGGIGGLIGITAVTRAYVVDTTTEANRASMLSVHLGLNSLGALIGTMLASKASPVSRSPVNAYYVLTGVYAAYVVYVWKIVPDSLTNKEKIQAQEAYKNAQPAETQLSQSTNLKRVASQFNPLEAFGPTTANTSGNPLRYDSEEDWSLPFLALGLVLAFIGASGFEDRFLLSPHYRWGYRMTAYGYFHRGLQIFAFLVLFPALKTASTPTLIVASSISTEEEKGFHSILRDFKIGCVSIAILLANYTVLSISPHSLLTAIPALIGGLALVVFQPALANVAVSKYERQGGKHIGRLFGSLALVEELGAIIAYIIPRLPHPALLVALYCLLRHVRTSEIHPNVERQLEQEEERLIGDY